MGSLDHSLLSAGATLVEMIAQEHRAQREGRWTEFHRTATAAACMRFEVELEKAKEAVDEATQGLPSDLVALLRDPSISIPRDHEVRLADGRTLWEHLQEWRNAPSNTASAE